MMRQAKISRKTKETEITVELNLDGTGTANISTAIGFFDHMLTNFTLHGLFDMYLQAKGDLEVDFHHTMEDVGLLLGAALDQALGERKGITRIADCFVPMDESLAQVVIDLSGRPYTVLNIQWNTPYVANIPTSLFNHFFESFAIGAHCNLHARILYGRDDHHQAEALFKALGRALALATRLDPRRNEQVPSTKGVLH
ncbi:MAG: imidazoleglycerol-phosphate dehydratase HisB [Anaerolineales bacterium]